MRSTALRSGGGICSRISAAPRGQVFDDVGRIVGIEIADAFGDDLGGNLVEDLLADRVVNLGQRGEVELAPQQLDKARPELAIKRLDQVAGVGLVQLADQCLQAFGVAAFDRLAHAVEKFGADRAVVVAERDRRQGPGHLSLIDHAGLAVARVLKGNRRACTPRLHPWQSQRGS